MLPTLPRISRLLGRSAAVALAIAALGLAPRPAAAIRVATYNLMFYPTDALSARQPNFRTVLDALDPDVLFCQEINSAAGKDSMLNNVLNVVRPGQWLGDWRDVTTGEGMAVFWKPAKVSIANLTTIATSGPRDVMWCFIRPNGYSAAGAQFRVYSQHFKAGNPGPDSTTRRLECADLRTLMNFIPATQPWLLLGDSNFYGDWEGGYIRLTESQTDNDGRAKDPLTMPGTWQNNNAYRMYHTQCPCLSGCISPTFSGGGMDDRFDIILGSYNIQDGSSTDMVPGTVTAYGNDGQHFNNDINADFFNNAVGYTVATALRNASDHIPVYVDIQVPSRVAAASVIDFGRVIVGAAPTVSYSVANGATPPADELTYSLAATAGFSAPGGGFTANAGVPGNLHTIGMTGSPVGPKAGTLTLTTNDPDSVSKVVPLSGNVVRHAVPSLDSSAVVTAALVDLGDHAILHFDDADVRVHDQGFDASQALLSIDTAVITGGAGRFSLVGGFAPSLIGDIGRTLTVRFDSYGATLDSTYDATLAIGASDEPLPGASPRPGLTVTLRARPISGVLATGDPRVRELRFHPARPNPLRQETTFAYDLPEPSPVSLEIFDLSGRRVATLAQGEQSAGRHQVSWRAMDDTGTRVAGGLYFARFSTRGLQRFERVVVLP